MALRSVMACLCGVVALIGVAGAQVHPNLNQYTIDPISFRGPDPAKRFKDIEIIQKREAQVPVDTLRFRNEKGEIVSLRDCMLPGKPLVLAMVYYECPSICNMVLNGLIAGLDAADMRLELGKDFTAVAVSINPNEGAELAAAKKANYLKNYHRAFGEQGLRFLTGDQEPIETLANVVGFRYFYEEATKQYAHAAGIMIITPAGKVSSYYFGTEYLPKRLSLALADAAEGKIGDLALRLQLLCYHYDPSVGAYGFYVMGAVRILGGIVLAGIVLFWGLNYLRNQRAARGGPLGDAGAGGGLASQP